MSVLTINVPDNLQKKAREIAAARDMTLDAFVATALAQALSRSVPDPYLEERSTRAQPGGISKFLAQAPDCPPPDEDRLPERYKPKR